MSVDGTRCLNMTNCSSQMENEKLLEFLNQAKIAVPIVFGIILISGVIGNGSVVLIVLRSKHMRTIPNIYILSLALGDLLLILIAVPFSAFIYTFKEWHFGLTLCKINLFMETFSLGISVFTLTLLSINRYLAICHPMRTRSGASLKKTICLASFVWIFSACLAIPDVVCSGLTHYTVTYCDPYHAVCPRWYGKFHVIYRFVIYFAIPIITIGMCYCLMAKTLVCDSSDFHDVMPHQHGASRTQASRIQVAKLVLSLVVVFAVCWLPRHIFLLGQHFDLITFGHFWYVFKMAGFCLAFINSCVNPLALYLQSEQFWKCFCMYFCKCFSRDTDHSNRGSSPRSSQYQTKTTHVKTNTTYIEMCKTKNYRDL